ncbi:MAG: hypothetical protein ACOVSW_01730 [Candidatus Kapaibacteriota bacterium]
MINIKTLLMRYLLLILSVDLLYANQYSLYAQQQTAVGYTRAFSQNLTFYAPLEMLPSNDGTGKQYSSL